MYSAYVTTLKDLHKHSNADRLQCATVFGNNVIVDLSYQNGQRVVFFPVDGQLSEEFAYENNLVRKKDENGNNIGGYLDPDKRNIKALSLRGEKSEGLVLPISTLAKYTNIDELTDGDQITILDGHEICRKYIPRASQKRRHGRSGKHSDNNENENISYPLFLEHSDTQQLAFNQNAFKPGDTCYITLKMHGTSARTANTIRVEKKPKNIIQRIFKLTPKDVVSYKPVSGTRRTILNELDSGFRKPYHDYFAAKLPKGVEVYYEIVGYQDCGKPIMGSCSNKKIQDKSFRKLYGDTTVFSYGCADGQCNAYVYRMTMTNEDGFTVELPWEQVQIEAERIGANCVPTFEKFIYTTWEDLMERVEKYYDGADPIGKTHVREGVVVRIDNRPTFKAYKHKNFSFKVLSGIIADSVDENADVDAEILSEM